MEHPIKNGTQRQITVDIGQGPNVGVTFESTSPTHVTVDSTGLVQGVFSPDAISKVYVVVKDANSVEWLTLGFDLCPDGTDTTSALANLPPNVSVGPETPVA